MPASMEARRLAASAILLAAAGLAVPPALAGDAADLNILGFSADGGVFAFEEYGVQDGSGFPYANRFYIDMSKDSFLAGSPIRVVIEEDGATTAKARQQARAQGKAIVPDLVLEANFGFTAALNPIGEYSADPWRVVVGTTPNYLLETTEFRLEEVAVAQPADCADWGEVKGFRLTRLDPAPGGTTKLLHEDMSVPKSRGCAIGYRIGGVQIFPRQGGEPSFVVLVAVRKVGFEGPDYRWIAVPVPAKP